MFIILNVSIFLHDLTHMFQLTGSMYGLILQLILPVAFYIKAYKKEVFEPFDFMKEDPEE